MNPKVQLEKLKRDIEWIFYQVLVMKKSYAAIVGVSEVSQKTDALSNYGDYFAYTQNIMIGELQLQLAKLFVDDKESHSIQKIIYVSNSLFTREYYKSTGYNQHITYYMQKEILNQLEKNLIKLENPISNLKKLRDKDLAHFDHSISNPDSRKNLVQSNPISVADVQNLLDYAFNSISVIKGLIFNTSPKFQEPDYTYELEKIAELIEKAIKKEEA